MPDITLDSLGSAAEVARRNRERSGAPLDTLLEGLAQFAPGLSIGQLITQGIPAAAGGLNEGARQAFEEAGSLQRGGSYNAGPVTLQALGAIGAPMVGPAQGVATLGAGAMRRAASAAVPKADMYGLTAAERAAPRADAPYPQFAEQYPAMGPGTYVEQTDPAKIAKGNLGYTEKTLTPEAEKFAKARGKIQTQMDKEGYTPFFDPEKRFYVDPKNYPGANVDTLTIKPSKPETIGQYLKVTGSEETAKALEAAYKRGGELGNADHWYAMGQLEAQYVKELGEKAGRKAFLDEFAVPMASTTSGQSPAPNFLMAQYLEHARKQGLPFPAGGHELPVTVGGRRPAMNLRDYSAMREGGGYSYLGEDQPKMHNFARSFLGDLSRAVMDEQMSKGMVAHVAKADPNFADRARKGAFGMLEEPLHALAKRLGIQPGNVQDVAWAGFKNEAGGPMIGVINDAIERTHRLTGMSRDEIVRRGIVRKEIPVYTPGAIPIGNLGGNVQEQ